jgi:hypothetical protein
MPSQEEYRLLERTLMEKVLDRVCADPEWKRRLLEDPEAAMQEAAFPEAQRLKEVDERIWAHEEEAEVVGQYCPQTAYPQCASFTYFRIDASATQSA